MEKLSLVDGDFWANQRAGWGWLSDMAIMRTFMGLGVFLGLLELFLKVRNLVVEWIKIARLLDRRSHLARGGVIAVLEPSLSIHRGREELLQPELPISGLEAKLLVGFGATPTGGGNPFEAWIGPL